MDTSVDLQEKCDMWQRRCSYWLSRWYREVFGPGRETLNTGGRALMISLSVLHCVTCSSCRVPFGLELVLRNCVPTTRFLLVYHVCFTSGCDDKERKIHACVKQTGVFSGSVAYARHYSNVLNLHYLFFDKSVSLCCFSSCKQLYSIFWCKSSRTIYHHVLAFTYQKIRVK